MVTFSIIIVVSFSVIIYSRRAIFYDGEDGEDNGTTGISNVRSQMPDATGEFYDLQGRRVMQPKKGLYIQNGRKAIVK